MLDGQLPRALVASYMPSNRLSNMNENILMSGLSNFIILIITCICEQVRVDSTLSEKIQHLYNVP